jgi:hypothetical protein
VILTSSVNWIVKAQVTMVVTTKTFVVKLCRHAHNVCNRCAVDFTDPSSSP